MMVVGIDIVFKSLIAIVGFFAAFQFKRMAKKMDDFSDKIGALETKVAVLSTVVESVKDDHDRLIICESKAKAAHSRLDNLERAS